MKKLYLAIAPVIIAFMFSSCAAGIEQDVSNLNTVTDVVTTGKWKVEVYLDANQDQSNDFLGYSFTFTRNGGLSATTGNVTTSGTWVEDVMTRKLTLNFPAGDPILQRINDVWKINEVGFRTISLSSNNLPQNEYLGISQQ